MPITLPPRPADAHKGTFGRILIFAGSPGMSGAACLASSAALRSGSGLVTVAVPRSIQSVVAGFEPSCMTVGLACGDDEQLRVTSDEELAGVLREHLSNRDAVGIGPGLGKSPGAVELVRSVIRMADVPLVLDADALNIVAEHAIPMTRSAPTIITPHPGEFSRLVKKSPADISADRTGMAQKFARAHHAIVVLKGHHTIVTNGEDSFENTTGNSGMATGGTGDVLTGILTSLCGQGLAPYEAAVAAVYAHGLAGDLCAAATSARGMIASDLLHWLPAAWAQLDSHAPDSSGEPIRATHLPHSVTQSRH